MRRGRHCPTPALAVAGSRFRLRRRTASSAPDQNDPSALTSFTAIGCPLEKTRPAIPLPGGILIFSRASSSSLTATKNLRPPSRPSRTSTEASAEPTVSAAIFSRSSMPCRIGAARESESFTASITSRILALLRSSIAASGVSEFELSGMFNSSCESSGRMNSAIVKLAFKLRRLRAKRHYTDTHTLGNRGREVTNNPSN